MTTDPSATVGIDAPADPGGTDADGRDSDDETTVAGVGLDGGGGGLIFNLGGGTGLGLTGATELALAVAIAIEFTETAGRGARDVLAGECFTAPALTRTDSSALFRSAVFFTAAVFAGTVFAGLTSTALRDDEAVGRRPGNAAVLASVRRAAKLVEPVVGLTTPGRLEAAKGGTDFGAFAVFLPRSMGTVTRRDGLTALTPRGAV